MGYQKIYKMLHKTLLQFPGAKLVGITARTNNKNESNLDTAKILPCVEKYFQDQVAQTIPGRKTPNRTICAFTDYASDYMDDYTFFIGEKVGEFGNLPAGLKSLIIPAQTYAKFTTESGPMPAVVINAWQEIWQMSDAKLGGQRSYQTDFEVYDERALNRQNTILDIYVGVESLNETTRKTMRSP